MKILHIIRSTDPAGGGPIEGIKQLALALSQEHHIEVVSLDPPDATFLANFPLPVHPLGPAWLSYGYSSRIVPWLRRHRKDYDVVIINGIWQYHAFAAWRVLGGSDTPYFVFTHGMLGPWFKRKYPLKHLKKWLYWPWADYRVLRDAAAVLFTCEEERLLGRQSFSLYRCHEVVVDYGIARPNCDANSERAAFFDAYSRLRGKRLALFLGRIHPIKGCDLLIQAFASVLGEDRQWHLVVAGPDQVGWRQKLVRLAETLNVSDRVTFTGTLNGREKWGALAAAEVLILPSHHENFGIVVAEALAFGLPALISNKVNIWREVQENGAGIIGEDDLDGTCAVLKTWSELSSRQKSDMRKRAYECFQQRFEIRAAADSLIRTLSSFSSSRPTMSPQPPRI